MRIQRLLLVLAMVVGLETVQQSASQACVPGSSHGFLAGPNSTLPGNARGLLYIGSGTTSVEDFEIGVFRRSSWVTVPVVVHRHSFLHRAKSMDRLSYDRANESDPLQIEFDRGGFEQQHYLISVAPQGGFVVGERYRIRTTLEERIVRVGAKTIDLSKLKLKLISSTGTAVLEEPLGCGHSARFRAAHAKISLTLPKRLDRYRQHLLYETLVDGQPWEPPFRSAGQIPGRSRHGIGEDIVYIDCGHSRDNSLVAGTHSVAIRVYFPTASGTQTLQSRPVKIHLSCS